VDFADLNRKSLLAGKKLVTSISSKAQPIEYFWLCEKCSNVMTIELTDAGEVRLVPLEGSAQIRTAAAAPQTRTQWRAIAS
jgi:hypothetical protein